MWGNIKLFFEVYFQTLSNLLGGYKFVADLAEVLAYTTVLLCSVAVFICVTFACFGVFVFLVG